MVENRVFRNTFWPKRERERGKRLLQKLHNDYHHNLHCSPKNDSGDEITKNEMSNVCGKYSGKGKNISGLGGESFKKKKKKKLVGRL